MKVKLYVEQDNTMTWTKGCLICIISVLICLMTMFGCDNKQEIKQDMSDPKAVLEKVAVEYWTKRFIDKDYKATYDMELEKGSLSFEKYLQRVQNAGQIDYISIENKEVKIDKDRGNVVLTVTCRIIGIPKPVKKPHTDEWVIESNQWKHILREK